MGSSSDFFFFPLECRRGSCNVYQPVKLSARTPIKATAVRRA
ncbi:hypothetical protein EKH55_2505 [Sinorhizobium alkalisoli]|nr:hypothetical protein EKH55_2505 [Sinorhizobium alkalisoli]